MDKNPLVLLELVERLANLMRAELRRAGADENPGSPAMGWRETWENIGRAQNEEDAGRTR